ncbi:RodZ domain-containing protein [Aestuariirhabdus sp. LZHN29]|uniref:RodZ domain-containing protein n=1 Tax=Aestuariirhabdus sp. LZHN29 TaxID=3417462 RepID=UPI003CE96708
MSDEDKEGGVVPEVTDTVIEASGPTPGDLLLAAREKLGLSEQEVAERLKVTVDYVRALDSCAYDRLPGLTFTRGYIRGYAQLVELDPGEVIGQFDAFVGEQAPSYNSATVPMKPLKQPSSPAFRWIAYLLLAALVAASLFWWQGRSPDVALVPAEPSSTVAVTAAPAPLTAEESALETSAVVEAQEASVVVDSITPIAPMAPADAQTVAVPLTAPANEPEAEVVVAPETVSVPVVSLPVAASEGVEGPLLKIDFTRECWVEVRSESGNVMVASLRGIESPVSVKVSEPVRVLLGDVGAVSAFEFDGEPVVLANYTRGKIANLTLGDE